MALLGNGAISTNKKATIGNLVESLVQHKFSYKHYIFNDNEK